MVEQLNQHLGIDSRKKVSTGLVVKAMLLNNLWSGDRQQRQPDDK